MGQFDYLQFEAIFAVSTTGYFPNTGRRFGLNLPIDLTAGFGHIKLSIDCSMPVFIVILQRWMS
jgi:hypothetical protein